MLAVTRMVAVTLMTLVVAVATSGCATWEAPEKKPMTRAGNVPPGADETNRVIARGIASWYGDDFAGKPTASGEPFDPKAFTCAHPTLPFGTWLRVTVIETGKSVSVRVNDRFPATKGRIIDLSARAFAQIAPLEQGTAEVNLRAITVKPTDQYPSAPRVAQPAP